MSTTDIGQIKFERKPKHIYKSQYPGKDESSKSAGSELFIVPWQLIQAKKKKILVE